MRVLEMKGGLSVIQQRYRITNRVWHDMCKATDIEGIKNVYRQARNWNRYQHFLGYAYSYETYLYLSKKFKAQKIEAIKLQGR